MSLAYVLACTKATIREGTKKIGEWSFFDFLVSIKDIVFNENITMDSYVLWRIGEATGLDTKGPSLFNPLGTCRAISEEDAEKLNNATYHKGTCRAVKDSCVSKGERKIEVRGLAYPIEGKAYDHGTHTCRRSHPSIHHINLFS